MHITLCMIVILQRCPDEWLKAVPEHVRSEWLMHPRGK